MLSKKSILVTKNNIAENLKISLSTLSYGNLINIRGWAVPLLLEKKTKIKFL